MAFAMRHLWGFCGGMRRVQGFNRVRERPPAVLGPFAGSGADEAGAGVGVGLLVAEVELATAVVGLDFEVLTALVPVVPGPVQVLRVGVAPEEVGVELGGVADLVVEGEDGDNEGDADGVVGVDGGDGAFKVGKLGEGLGEVGVYTLGGGGIGRNQWPAQGTHDRPSQRQGVGSRDHLVGVLELKVDPRTRSQGLSPGPFSSSY